MKENQNSQQTEKSIDKNITYFRDNLHEYGKNVQELDTYVTMRKTTNEAIKGIDNLLDIGNGGVFDYDVSLANHIVALDLFLDQIDTSSFPSHVVFKKGSALDIPERDASFDGVIMVMLLHHIVGKTVSESLNNVEITIREAMRVLKPGGKLIIVESCVPSWFYVFERLVFRPASMMINLFIPHPITLQYPVTVINNIASKYSTEIEVYKIPKGKWVLQYGFRFPSVLTPINPYRLVIIKR